MDFEGRFDASQGGFEPLSCNTGVHRPVPTPAPPFRLDWLRVSCPDVNHPDLSFLLRSHGLHPKMNKGKHGYDVEDIWYEDFLCVGKPLLRVWHGGEAQRGRMTIEASGRGSERVASILARSGVAFTLRRADLALDLRCAFGDGRDIVLFARERWPYKGTKPSLRMIDDLGSGEGCTLYLGTSSGLCMARWYEKGKEQRDLLNQDWMRLEFQIQPQSREQGDWMAEDILAGKFDDVLQVTWAPHVLKGFIADYGDRVIKKEVKMVKDFDDKLDVLTHQWRRMFDIAVELSGGDAEGFRQMFLDSMARNDKRAAEARSAHALRDRDLRDDPIPY